MHQLVYPFNKKWLSTHECARFHAREFTNNGPFLSKQCECVHCIHGYLSHSSVNVCTVHTHPFLHSSVNVCCICGCLFHNSVNVSSAYLAIFPTTVWSCQSIYVCLSHSNVNWPLPKWYLFSMTLWMCPLHTWPFFPPTRFPKEKTTSSSSWLLSWDLWMTSELMK